MSACTCAFMNNVCGRVGLHGSEMVFECGGDGKGASVFPRICVDTSLCVCVCLS